MLFFIILFLTTILLLIFHNHFNPDDNSDEDKECIEKSGRMWRISVPPVTRRQRCNIVRETPGPTHSTDHANTILEVCDLFLDDKIVICTLPNAEASRVFEDVNGNAAPNRIKT